MKDDIREDLQDCQEIAKQKAEKEITQEEMGTWKFGEGITREREFKDNVRREIQQKS